MENRKPVYSVFGETVDGRMCYGLQEEGGARFCRLSDERLELEALAGLLNRAGCSPIHFSEVVEDFRHG
ncbi:hypothetical protein [Harryflintia acetispora]|uniref:hypothetical protein n=1 Tax=Harryflintia acetispora TaxID=1849041 RepID=UPI00189824F4|nr:hypothetical protein [Harryflintia acetispora]